MFGSTKELRKENFEYMTEKYHMLSDLRNLENSMMAFINDEAEKAYNKKEKLEELEIDPHLYDALENVHNMISKYSPYNTAPVGLNYPKLFIYYTAFGPVQVKRKEL